MAKGILGTKVGMTQIFNDEGNLVPVTVVSCEPNVVLQKKTIENDGYEAVQLGFVDKRVKLANKPELGHFAKSNSKPKRYLKEIAGTELSNFEVGQEIRVNIFEEGEIVDVTGTSKGKGFQGVVKRYNFAGNKATHGQKHTLRAPGSIGATGPGRVFKGMRMAGRMGTDKKTVKNLNVLQVNVAENLLLVSGAVPGRKGTLVEVRNA